MRPLCVYVSKCIFSKTSIVSEYFELDEKRKVWKLIPHNNFHLEHHYSKSKTLSNVQPSNDHARRIFTFSIPLWSNFNKIEKENRSFDYQGSLYQNQFDYIRSVYEYNVNDRSIILQINLEYIAMSYFNIYAFDISDSLDLL